MHTFLLSSVIQRIMLISAGKDRDLNQEGRQLLPTSLRPAHRQQPFRRRAGVSSPWLLLPGTLGRTWEMGDETLYCYSRREARLPLLLPAWWWNRGAVRDLGVEVDCDLWMAAHVGHITSLCFFHLRQLRLLRRSLTTDATHSLVCALIHSRLDYCNGLFAGLPAGQMVRLQSVLRAAARFIRFSCQVALLCQPTCATRFIGSATHNESSSSCVWLPTSVSMVLHLHTCRSTVSHCLPTPVGLNCVLQKFVSCLFRESAQPSWVLVDSTMCCSGIVEWLTTSAPWPQSDTYWF